MAVVAVVDALDPLCKQFRARPVNIEFEYERSERATVALAGGARRQSQPPDARFVM